MAIIKDIVTKWMLHNFHGMNISELEIFAFIYIFHIFHMWFYSFLRVYPGIKTVYNFILRFSDFASFVHYIFLLPPLQNSSFAIVTDSLFFLNRFYLSNLSLTVPLDVRDRSLCMLFISTDAAFLTVNNDISSEIE